jgi:hypothetical protein
MSLLNRHYFLAQQFQFLQQLLLDQLPQHRHQSRQNYQQFQRCFLLLHHHRLRQ